MKKAKRYLNINVMKRAILYLFKGAVPAGHPPRKMAALAASVHLTKYTQMFSIFLPRNSMSCTVECALKHDEIIHVC
ncbi:hypothetical protein [Collimonas sp. PA-H2]|uniref:hypothetical protein n=1 Tax=Collimonas sp. PA-H2 TaxID=1881062 RepID=UPI0011812E1D|nr:hypothetical protein [Collimonas sp. PA-H2]